MIYTLNYLSKAYKKKLNIEIITIFYKQFIKFICTDYFFKKKTKNYKKYLKNAIWLIKIDFLN